MFDIIVLGSGPAGLSAAITARQRNMSVAVISNSSARSGLYKAREINNYPGFPGISGQELSDKLTAHAAGMGTELVTGRVTNILPVGSAINVAYGSVIESARSVIIASGIVQSEVFPGEAELVGAGVSYCATCDGMLFRKKRVCVVRRSPEAESEAEYLESIGCEVVRIDTDDVLINGAGGVVKSITADGEEIQCQGVFILRQAIAPHLLLPGLYTEGGHIAVDGAMRTNILGVFAAGDCVGRPYQIVKAAGQGQLAALSAAEYLAGNQSGGGDAGKQNAERKTNK